MPYTASPALITDFVRPALPTPDHAALWRALEAGALHCGDLRRGGARGRRVLDIARQWEEMGLVTVRTLERGRWSVRLVPAMRPPRPPKPATLPALGTPGEDLLQGVGERDFARAALSAVQEAVQAVFGHRAPHRESLTSYKPVTTASGDLAGWTFKIYHRTHWVSVHGVISPDDVTAQEESDFLTAKWPFPTYDPHVAQHAVLAAFAERAPVMAPATAAVRRVWPDAVGLRAVESDGTTVGYVCQAGPLGGSHVWVAADGSAVDHFGHDDRSRAEKALRDAHAAAELDREVAAVAGAALPVLEEDAARAALDAGNAELHAVQDGGQVLGYLVRLGPGMAAGYGWVTAFGSRHAWLEDTLQDAEAMLRTALAVDVREGRAEQPSLRELRPPSRLLTVAGARERVAAALPGGRDADSWVEIRRRDAEDEVMGWQFTLPGSTEEAPGEDGWITRHGLVRGTLRYVSPHPRRLRELCKQDAQSDQDLLEMGYAYALAKASAIPH